MSVISRVTRDPVGLLIAATGSLTIFRDDLRALTNRAKLSTYAFSSFIQKGC